MLLTLPECTGFRRCQPPPCNNSRRRCGQSCTLRPHDGMLLCTQDWLARVADPVNAACHRNPRWCLKLHAHLADRVRRSFALGLHRVGCGWNRSVSLMWWLRFRAKGSLDRGESRQEACQSSAMECMVHCVMQLMIAGWVAEQFYAAGLELAYMGARAGGIESSVAQAWRTSAKTAE
jgi:hypothetical protein